jgi:hypothetical protein
VKTVTFFFQFVTGNNIFIGCSKALSGEESEDDGEGEEGAYKCDKKVCFICLSDSKIPHWVCCSTDVVWLCFNRKHA